MALAIMIVVTRLYTQARITKQFGPSDYLMLCSIIVITTFASLISVQYHYGWGRHQSCITDIQELETQIKYNVTGQCFGIMGSTFGRLSFIVFMVKLFGSKRWVWWLLWTMFVAQVVTNLGTAITIYTQCKDPRALYDFSMPYDLCWPAYVETVSIFQGSFHVSSLSFADSHRVVSWVGAHVLQRALRCSARCAAGDDGLETEHGQTTESWPGRFTGNVRCVSFTAAHSPFPPGPQILTLPLAHSSASS